MIRDLPIITSDRLSMAITLVMAVTLIFLLLPQLEKTREPITKPSPLADPQKTVSQPLKMQVVALPLPRSPTPSPSVKVKQKVQKQSADKTEKEIPSKLDRKQDTLSTEPASSVLVENVTTDLVAEGRVLLKLLETGKGSDIEIAWPRDNNHRENLYNALVRCLQLQSGVMNSEGQIFLASGQPGQPAVINPDKISLFLRQSSGQLPRSENRLLESIKRRHSQSMSNSVRLFSRNVDAAFLGGLFRVIPMALAKKQKIRATYHLENHAVTIRDIIVDDINMEGRVKVSLGLLGRCR